MNNKTKIAFVTCQEIPDLTEDDHLVAASLRDEFGVIVEPAIWNSSTVRWQDYGSVVIRSTWDYHLQVPSFLKWLQDLDENVSVICNPTKVLRWNVDKIYLQELMDAGIQCIPTVWGTSTTDVVQVRKEQGWDRLFCKPRYGATGHGAFCLESSSGDEETSAVKSFDHYMIQPVMTEIQCNGELSLVFLGGTYSHAFQKKPAHGSLFVQPEFGGTERSYDPSAKLQDTAQHVLETAARILQLPTCDILYARVDGILVGDDGDKNNDNFLLMELELIEPSLSLYLSKEAPRRMAAEIVKKLEETRNIAKQSQPLVGRSLR